MISQATSTNIIIRAIERTCDKYDIRMKESHKTILAILIPAIIYKDGKIIILSETVHQINRALKKQNESIDFVSMLLAYNCISHIDKYGVITIPLCVLLNKLTINREIVGSMSNKYLSKKVLTNPTTTLCASEILKHIGVPYIVSIPVVNIVVELLAMKIDDEYKAMQACNVAFKDKKMSETKEILKQMHIEKIFVSTGVLLIITNIGLKISTNLILISVLEELYYIIRAEYKKRTAKGVLK